MFFLLNAMLLGEKYAQSMGISICLSRFLMVMVSSVLTARLVLSPTELPLGVMTAIVGVPIVAYLLIEKRR